jgi:hypothetical protein
MTILTREGEKMPSKHIDSSIWREVEDKTVFLIGELGRPIRDTEVLKYLIVKGLQTLTSEELKSVKLLEEASKAEERAS